MLSAIKNFKNANWFIGHFYAYKNLAIRRKNIAKGRKFIYNAELFLDSRCNLQCKHCSISKFQNQPNFKSYMSIDDVTRVAEELSRMNCFLCCLVGGELTIREDLLNIVSIFHTRKILPTIITNGYLIDAKYVKALKRAGIFNIGVSLNGANAESHDLFVGKQGAFKKALESVDLIRKAGICVSIAVVPTHENIANGDFRRMIEFAIAKKIRVNVNYPALAGEFTKCYDELLTQKELKEIKKYFKLPNVTSDFTVISDKYECPAGRKKIYILPDGSVCPCTFIHISFGNILSEPLEEIMGRIWSTKIFMSRPKCCLVGESPFFNDRYLSHVFNSKELPLYYKDHPLLK